MKMRIGQAAPFGDGRASGGPSPGGDRAEDALRTRAEGALHAPPSAAPPRVLLHPFHVARLGGLPIAAARFSDGAAARALAQAAASQAAAAAAAASACAALETALRPFLDAADAAATRALLQLKRDLHNLRAPRERQLAAAADLLGPAAAAAAAVHAAAAAIARLADARAAAPAAHAEELRRAEDAALARFAEPALRAALELTSPAVARQAAALAAARDAGRPVAAKQRAMVATGIARYVMRASLKTTPQSSLGSAAAGRWSDPGRADSAAPLLPIRVAGPPARALDLRHAAVHHPLLRCAARLENLADDAPIGLAPLRPTAGGSPADAAAWMWTQTPADEPPDARVRGARHALARGGGTAAALLRRLFAAAGAPVLPLAALRAAVSRAAPGDPDRLLRPALAAGLLRVRAARWGQLPLDDWVAAATAPLRPPLRAAARAACDALARSLDAVRAAAPPARGEALAAVETAFAALLAATGDDPSAAPAFQPLLHEDCSDPVPPADRAAAEAIAADLAGLLALAPLLSKGNLMGVDHAALLRRLFIARHGADGACADVPALLDDYAAALAVAPPAEPPATPTENAARSLAADFLDGVASQAAAPAAAAAGVLALDAAWLRALADRLPAPLAARRRSHTVLGQFFTGAGDARGFVVNQIYPGLGRMLSRFLPADPASAAAVGAYLDAAFDGRRRAAIPGAFGFNANRHPRCAADELAIDPYDPDRPETGKIALADLSLRLDPATDRLMLHTADGAPLEAHYGGLLLPEQLPPAHRALAALAPGSEAIEPFWLAVVKRLPGFGERPVALPRITLGAVALARRTWFLPAAALPAPQGDAAAFFAAMLEWAAANGLPRHLFFHRRNGAAALPRARAGLPPGRYTDLVRKMMKPMPLDLHCPLGVRMLQKSLQLHDDDVVLAEALPGPDDSVASRDGAPLACELALELTIPARPAAAAAPPRA